MFMIPIPEITSAIADTSTSTRLSTREIFRAASRMPVRFSALLGSARAMAALRISLYLLRDGLHVRRGAHLNVQRIDAFHAREVLLHRDRNQDCFGIQFDCPKLSTFSLNVPMTVNCIP